MGITGTSGVTQVEAVPTGGAQGQVLTKASDVNFDTVWVSAAASQKIFSHAVHAAGNASFTLTNMPAADTFIGPSQFRTITKLDLTNYSEGRMLAGITTSGTATSRLFVRYGASYSTTEADFSNLGTSEIGIGLGNGGFAESNWTTIVSAARTDVFIGIIGSGGDGVVSPALHNLYLQFR